MNVVVRCVTRIAFEKIEKVFVAVQNGTELFGQSPIRSIEFGK